jgi:hypothetical protein
MLKHMKSYAHLKPGSNGTKGLVEKYGDALLCVRYRYDEIRGVRLKTAEIIVEERGGTPSLRHRDDDIVQVAVAYTEKGLREQLKAAGGRWDREEKLWRVRYGSIKGIADLTERIQRGRLG